jgi:hypothetical protein
MAVRRDSYGVSFGMLPEACGNRFVIVNIEFDHDREPRTAGYHQAISADSSSSNDDADAPGPNIFNSGLRMENRMDLYLRQGGQSLAFPGPSAYGTLFPW